MTLIILRGISGSGKSTFAETMQRADERIVIVSRDRIRMALFSKEAFIDEDLVTKVEDAAIESGIRAGHHVIVDDTNVRVQYVKRLVGIGQRLGAQIDVKEFWVELWVAKARNEIRAGAGGRNVPEKVIEKQYNSFKQSRDFEIEPAQELKPYDGTPGKPKAFMVDIDGTLAHMNGRSPFEWHRVGEDAVDQKIADIVQLLRDGAAEQVEDWNWATIILSGRDSVCREQTEEWLNYHFIHYDELFMRPANDYRKDNIVKAELFDQHVRDKWDVQFVLDDRDQVVEMWRAMGLTCLQVAPGAF